MTHGASPEAWLPPHFVASPSALATLLVTSAGSGLTTRLVEYSKLDGQLRRVLISLIRQRRETLAREKPAEYRTPATFWYLVVRAGPTPERIEVESTGYGLPPASPDDWVERPLHEFISFALDNL